MTRSQQVLIIAAAICIGGAGYGAGYFTRSAPRMVAAAAAPVRTVSWYRQHQSDLKQKLAACNDDPGAAMTDVECQNAAEAKSQIDMDEFQGKQPSDK
ncbi:MAG: EexN family lipoprotein [Stellaceae bacterium]